MAGIPIGVLLYVNRSGSTLLSRLVSDGCEGVFVFPEMGFIVALLIAARAGRPIPGDALLRLIEQDPRRSALDVPAAALAGICAAGGTIGDVLRAIATAACARPPAAILVKHEALAYLAPAITATMGDVRFLHVVRDPRAVAASMRRTPVPEKPGFDMARGSLLYPARHWRDYLRRVRALASRHRVTELRYEDLERDACAAVAGVLDVRLRGAEAAESRYRVAPLDHALHARIHAPFDERRNMGWRGDLSPRDIALVEMICAAGMAAHGYAPVGSPASPRMMAIAHLRHAVAMARHGIGTARHYLRRPDRLYALRRRLALMLHKRRGG